MRIITVLFVSAIANAASAQTRLQGDLDFDGDGKSDTLSVEHFTSEGLEKFSLVVRLAAKPEKRFVIQTGPADTQPSAELRPPGVYKRRNGEEVALTTNSFQWAFRTRGGNVTQAIKAWDPLVREFVNDIIADNSFVARPPAS